MAHLCVGKSEQRSSNTGRIRGGAYGGEEETGGMHPPASHSPRCYGHVNELCNCLCSLTFANEEKVQAEVFFMTQQDKQAKGRHAFEACELLNCELHGITAVQLPT